MTSIVKFMMKAIQFKDDSDFIDKHFNSAKGLFPISDGKTVNLKTGEIRDRVKEDYFTKSTSVSLLEKPNSSLVRDYFKEILSTENDTYIDYVIDTIGYIMTNENNLKRFYVMIGVKDTGKSLFLDLLQRIFGFLGGMANDKVFKLKSSSCHDTEAFSLEGKRFASISELSEHEQFNEVLMKKISGGDSINIRRAGSKINEEVQFNSVLILATNEVPAFHEEAFAGRMRAINFRHIFKNNPERRDEILANIDSFFTEFVKGAKRYYTGGAGSTNKMNIVDCEEVIVASRDLVNSKNPVTKYWEEQTEFEFVDNIKKRVKKVDIWKSFVDINGSKILGRNKFFSMFMDIYKKELLNTSYNQGLEWSGIQRITNQFEFNDNNDNNDFGVMIPLK